MLKKLRLKFILINMTIVTIMLGVIFGLLYYSTSRNLERESMQMMESVAINPMPPSLPNRPHDEVRLPYFSVMINHAGEAVEIGGGFFDMSDKEYLRELLQVTFDTHTSTGVVGSSKTIYHYLVYFSRTISGFVLKKNALDTFSRDKYPLLTKAPRIFSFR